MRFPCATMHSDALRHNLAVVRRTAPAARVLAIIKANAYGHGILATAKALASADAFGVARLEEGLALRAAGIANRIVLLEGMVASDELQIAGREQFDLVVHCIEQLELLEQYPAAGQFTVWLKIDTGMNRLGFRVEDFASAWRRLQLCKSVGQVRLMTHLTAAEEAGGAAARLQIARFRTLSADLVVECSIANSAGLVALPESRGDWVRPGLMLYGISPLASVTAPALGLRPVMTLATQIIALRRVPRGEAVGYNGIWRASRDSVIGIAAIGYGDGYPRNMRSGAPVLVDGMAATVAGRVSMDMTALDVTDLADVRVGSNVVLWGEGLPAEIVAPYADTIAYELVCGISQRVTVQWSDAALDHG